MGEAMPPASAAAHCCAPSRSDQPANLLLRSTINDNFGTMNTPPSPAGPTAPVPRRRSLTRFATYFLAAVCLSLLAVQGWSSYSARETYLSEANRSTVNMARALADHAEASIDLVDTLLAGIVERVEDGEVAEEPARVQTFLADMVHRTPSLQGLFLYDAQGRWLLNSLETPAPGFNNADREYFIYHRTHADRTAHIGTPVRSRSSGVWIIPVSRRLNHADGSFAGVALATIKLDYFRSFYESFAIGSKGTIFLVADSGRLLLRLPFHEKEIGADISQGRVFQLWYQMGPSGSAILVSRIDQVERLYAYRHLRRYPLLIGVAPSKQEILARWRTNTYAGVAGTLSLLVVLLLLGLRMIRQLIERDRLQRELRAAKTALGANNASLKLLALSDGLTGLANRRHFDQRLSAEFKRAIRDRSPIALVMIDVDYFKNFNDHHGHVAGDACLQMVGKAVMAGQRRLADVAARFGGEEFAILLPDTGLEGALAVAESVRAAIAGLNFAHGASPLRIVTVSAGVHALVPVRGQPASALVEAADRGLYQAKAEGRNRVCAAAPAQAAAPRA
jgi:diguanylate cyclase (GGDEF)-like protein